MEITRFPSLQKRGGFKAVTATDTFRSGSAQLLFTSNPFIDGVDSYCVAPDGQRLLMMKPTGTAADQTVTLDINLVLVKNFATEVARRVPANN